MNTLKYILDKYGLDKDARLPLVIKGGRRTALAGLFGELGFKRGAEIGVQKGEYSAILCEIIPGLKLYCIDPWIAYEGYNDFKGQAVFDDFHRSARKRLAPYNCELMRSFSMDAVKTFEDESLDFVFIDGNHDFQNCTNDIVEWSRKVRKGGIISGHDYSRKRGRINIHCKDVINAYTYSYEIRPWFIVTGDRRASWFWVKS